MGTSARRLGYIRDGGTVPLTLDQVDAFRRDGCVLDVPALTEAEAERFLAELQTTIRTREARPGGWTDRHYLPHEADEHPLIDWFLELATHPAVLDNVAAVLGDDLLVRNGDLFLKTGSWTERVQWHRDSRRDGVDGMLTAWIALTEVTSTNGPLELALGSHDVRIELMRGSSLGLTAKARRKVEAMARTTNTMKAGHMSLHHPHTVHRSGPSEGALRAAFVVRYLSASTSPEAAEAGQAMLVRGRPPTGSFSLTSTFPVTWISDHRMGTENDPRFAVT